MTAMASLSLFGALVLVATGGAAVAAVVLAVLIVSDWRGGRLW
jgi:hypothetical protein